MVVEIEQKIKDILTETLGLRKDYIIKNEHTLAEDLDADSLDSMSAVIELENAFKIEISTAEVEAIVTVQDIINLIKERTEND